MEQNSGYGAVIRYFRSKDFLKSSRPRYTTKQANLSKAKAGCLICSVGLWQRQKTFCKTLFEKKICRPSLRLILICSFDDMMMRKSRDKAREIKNLQDKVLPQLKQQLADTKGLFKGKERKALEGKIKKTEAEIADRLDKIPDTSQSGRLS